MDNVNNSPSVSVVIPFYSGRDWLCEAVESALSQDFKDYEIIVVDDGSAEDMTGFAEEYGERIRYHRKENGGPASARNLGIDLARGAYIAFLDSDDLWLPRKLSRQLSKMKEYGAVWSYTDYETFGEGLEAKPVRMHTNAGEGFVERFSPYIGTPAVIVSRSFLRENDLSFDTELRYGQDALLWERLNSLARPLYLPGIMSRVRLRGSNAGKRAAVQLKARVMIYDKCVETIPGYKQSHSLLYRSAIALCRFGSVFVRNDKKGGFAEFSARALFVLPYLLFKLDRRLSG